MPAGGSGTQQAIDIVIRSRGAARTSREIGILGGNSRVAARGVGLLTRALGALGVALSIRELVQLADSFTLITNQVRLVTSSTEELVRVQRSLFEVAQSTRAPLEASAILFRRLALNADQLGLSSDELVGIVESVNQSVAITGATAREAFAGLIQLSQGLASGELRGEELRSVFEQLPGLARAIAAGLGVTIGELRELGFAGELTAEQVVRAIQSQAPQIAEEFEKVRPTIGQAFTTLNNALLQTVGTIDQAFSSTTTFSTEVVELSKTLDQTLISAFADVIDASASLIDVSADVVEVLESIGLTAGSVTGTLITLFQAGGGLVSAIETGVQAVRTGLLTVQLGLNLAAGLIDEEAFGRAQETLNRLNRAQIDLEASSQRTNDALVDLRDNLPVNFSDVFDPADADRASRGLREFAQDARRVSDEVRALADREGLDLGGDGEAPPPPPARPARTEDQADALEELIDLQQDLNRERLEAIDPLLGEIDAIDEQIQKVQELEVAEMDRARQSSIIRQLEVNRNNLLDGLLSGLQQEQGLVERIEARLAILRSLDRDRADDLQRQLDTLRKQDSVVDRIADGQDLLVDINDAIQEEAPNLGKTLSSILSDGLSGAFGASLRGEAFDFSEFFADVLEQQVQNALKRAFSQVENLINDVVGDAAGGLGGDGFAALAGAAAIGGALLAGGLRDTQSDIEQGAESAVDRIERVRGVVAGPTDIPIFQVGDAISDAFVPVVAELRENNALTQDILTAIRTLRLSGVADADILDQILQSEANASSSLA